MTVDEYNRLPYVNKSTLWEMRKSPLHYWHLIHDTPKEDTPAMRFGRAVHSFILTPDIFQEEYIIAPECDRRTKEGKAIWNKLAECGKEIISAEDHKTIAAMQREVMKTNAFLLDPSVKKETEIALTWKDDESGVMCKGRLDVITEDYVIDYKTTTDASTRAFKREALRYGYDLQAAMYMEAARANRYNPKGFIFIAQEKDPPYMVNVLHASDAFLDRGAWIMRDLLAKYKECRDKNDWPGYGVNELILNEWEVMADE